MKKRSLKTLIEDAGRARSDLNIFYGVIAILEGGTMSSDSDRNAQRIIAICQSASQQCLVRMDRAVAAALQKDKPCRKQEDLHMTAIAMKKEIQVEAKVLKIYCKVCDNFTANLVDQNGDTIHDQEDGYVPGFMPGEHYGDYLILDIDIDTGKVLNWKPPTAEDIQKWISKGKDA